MEEPREDDPEARLGALVAEWHALSAEVLAAMDDYEATQVWCGGGIATFGQWASINLGLLPSAARAMVATSRGLGPLPALAAALARGQLSYDKARLVAAVATPEREALWLDLALNASATQLARITSAYRRATALTPEDDDNEHGRRGLEFRFGPKGLVRLVATLEPEDAAVVRAAIERQAEETKRTSPPERRDEPRPTYAQSRADALVDLSRAALAADPGAGGEPGRPELIVHVDQHLLTGEGGDGAVGRCHTQDGAVVDPAAVRRLACDAALRPLLEAVDGRPLDVGRSRRVVSARQRQALWARDGGCQFPGCGARRFVDAHHVIHWLDGGPTDLDNLVLLCKRHHRLHHEGGYTIGRHTSGRLRFCDRFGRDMARPRLTPRKRRRQRRSWSLLMSPRAVGGGESFSLDLTMTVLCC
jgi:hypothetical protein